jgi:hypothetical protein
VRGTYQNYEVPGRKRLLPHLGSRIISLNDTRTSSLPGKGSARGEAPPRVPLRPTAEWDDNGSAARPDPLRPVHYRQAVAAPGRGVPLAE